MKSGQTIPTDQQLIAQLLDRQKEEEGILHLYESHYKSLSLFVIQHSGTEQDAQDIFQEVVVAFIHLVKENRFRGESSIKTFLYALNRNMWYNELKRRGRAGQRESVYEDGKETIEPSIQKTVESREASKEILALMNQLGENCKKILLLFYYENYSMREMLSALNYDNEQVVRNKKYKCLKKLGEIIGARQGLFHQLKNLLHG